MPDCTQSGRDDVGSASVDILSHRTKSADLATGILWPPFDVENANQSLLIGSLNKAGSEKFANEGGTVTLKFANEGGSGTRLSMDWESWIKALARAK